MEDWSDGVVEKCSNGFNPILHYSKPLGLEAATILNPPA